MGDAPAVTTRRVDSALFRAHHEVVDISWHEAQTRHRHSLALTMLQQTQHDRLNTTSTMYRLQGASIISSSWKYLKLSESKHNF